MATVRSSELFLLITPVAVMTAGTLGCFIINRLYCLRVKPSRALGFAVMILISTAVALAAVWYIAATATAGVHGSEIDLTERLIMIRWSYLLFFCLVAVPAWWWGAGRWRVKASYYFGLIGLVLVTTSGFVLGVESIYGRKNTLRTSAVVRPTAPVPGSTKSVYFIGTESQQLERIDLASGDQVQHVSTSTRCTAPQIVAVKLPNGSWEVQWKDRMGSGGCRLEVSNVPGWLSAEATATAFEVRDLRRLIVFPGVRPSASLTLWGGLVVDGADSECVYDPDLPFLTRNQMYGERSLIYVTMIDEHKFIAQAGYWNPVVVLIDICSGRISTLAKGMAPIVCDRVE